MLIAGDQEIVKFITEEDGNSITLKEIKDKIEELSQSQEDHKYTRLVPYPRLPVQFKSKNWTWKIARQVLSEYLEVEGFGKGSTKRYGKPQDEPENWPDTIGWVGFKGPSHVRLESCNEIIQSFLEGRQIDPNSYHLTERDVDVTEDNTETTETVETTETTETTEMDNNNTLTLDDSGKWYWSYHAKQWFPLTVDDSGNWFWSYEKQQWFLYTPPVINKQDVDDPPEQQSKEKEGEEEGQDHLIIVEL